MTFDKKAIRERLENARSSVFYGKGTANTMDDLNAALAEIERLEARIAVKDTQLLSVIGKSGKEVQLETENARYRKALEFYTKDHLYPPSVSMPLLMQLMHVASEALNTDAK